MKTYTLELSVAELRTLEATLAPAASLHERVVEALEAVGDYTEPAPPLFQPPRPEPSPRQPYIRPGLKDPTVTHDEAVHRLTGAFPDAAKQLQAWKNSKGNKFGWDRWIKKQHPDAAQTLWPSWRPFARVVRAARG